MAANLPAGGVETMCVKYRQTIRRILKNNQLTTTGCSSWLLVLNTVSDCSVVDLVYYTVRWVVPFLGAGSPAVTSIQSTGPNRHT